LARDAKFKRGSCRSPLSGSVVVVACSPLKLEVLATALHSLGAEVMPFQAIEIRDLSGAGLDAALERLERYDWLIFTSAYGVLFFSRRLVRPVPPNLRVCAIGPATAARARDCGLRVDLVPDEFVAEGVVRALARQCGGVAGIAGKRFLLPRAKEARDVIPDALSAAGALIDVVPCYETVQAPVQPELIRQIRERKPDLLVFTSSSNVVNFVSIMGRQAAGELLAASTVAVLGLVTARTLGTFGKHAEIIPAESSISALVDAIRAYWTREDSQRDTKNS
jgi:uroporphyrinogen III methyltransferase/synthase